MIYVYLCIVHNYNVYIFTPDVEITIYGTEILTCKKITLSFAFKSRNWNRISLANKKKI